MSLVILTHYSPFLKNTLPCGRRTSISHSLWSLGRKMKLVSELCCTVPPAHARLWVIDYWLKLFIGSVIKSTVVINFWASNESQSIYKLRAFPRTLMSVNDGFPMLVPPTQTQAIDTELSETMKDSSQGQRAHWSDGTLLWKLQVSLASGFLCSPLRGAASESELLHCLEFPSCVLLRQMWQLLSLIEIAQIVLNVRQTNL